MSISIGSLAQRVTLSGKSFPISVKQDILNIQDDKHIPSISLKNELPPLIDRWKRADNIAKAHALQFEENVLESSGNLATSLPWADKGRKALTYIGAGLYLLKLKDLGIKDIDDNTINKIGDREDFINLVAEYIEKIEVNTDIGTQADDEYSGDYDFLLSELATLLFVFVDDYELLTNNMIWSIVCQKGDGGCECYSESDAIATFSGQDLHTRKKVYKVVTIPETENHVLMIHAWKYLVNSYVYWVGNHLENHDRSHPRYDRRIKDLYDKNQLHYENENSQLEEFVLQAVGRVLHNGLFEENARPYESFSMRAIMNLYMGANALYKTAGGQKVKTAAQNAMEFLIAKYAFQSFQGKRISPMRRQREYRHLYDVGGQDYIPDIVGMLAGEYSFEDNFSYTKSRYYYKKLSSGARFALVTALIMSRTNYILPASLYDFLHNKHDGYWTRINTIYTKDHYSLKRDGIDIKPKSSRPKYFTKNNGDYIRYEEGEPDFSPEFYFCTSDFLNSSGGKITDYYPSLSTLLDIGELGGRLGSGVIEKVIDDIHEQLKNYDFISVPYSVILKGDIGRFWANGSNETNLNQMKNEIPIMLGTRYPTIQSGSTYNLSVFKNFSSSYIDQVPETGIKNSPFEYPSQWDIFPKEEFKIGNANFRIIDLRNETLNNIFIIFCSTDLLVFPLNPNMDVYTGGTIGFWEIVPANNRFPSLDRVSSRVIESNPESFFPSLCRTETTGEIYFQGSSNDFIQYKLAVSGDCIKFTNHIVEVSNANNQLYKLADFYYDERYLKKMPLLDVSEVDENFRFTGVKYASATGDGYVEIFNPYVGERLKLDSRDIMHPKHEIKKVI